MIARGIDSKAGQSTPQSNWPTTQAQLLREPDALQFSGRAFRDLGKEQNFPRRLVSREAFGEEGAELLLGRRYPLAQDDCGADVLAEHGMGQREGDRLQDGRVVHQRFVDLAWANFLSAAINDLLEAPGQREIALGVDDALIAGANPAVRERRGIGLRIVLVAGGDAWAANDHFAGLALVQEAPRLVHDRDLGARGEADCSR